MKHLIIGTAGHVDHGKTALIKALTDIDCDTHKEEKERGITINLGFSHLTLPTGEAVGIVDVPGHKDFIKTMVAGAFGIDIVLLVVAADSGIMPQTVEHSQIIDMLGVKHGIVVLNKIDLVDEEMTELAEMEISEFLEGTTFENAPIVKVSSVTKEGLDELVAKISEIIPKIEKRKSTDNFRMYIDRIFNVKGIGFVVTGSVLDGELKTGDELLLLPGKNKKVKARTIQRHGQPVDSVFTGDRAAINISGLKFEDYRRGMVLSGKEIDETVMVDATVTLFDIPVELKLWSKVIFYSGTFECAAKMHLLDKDTLNPGETAIVQIHLEKPAILLNDDRFIIRNSSNDVSLGGGIIIDNAPLHHRKRTPKLIGNLKNLVEAKLNSGNILNLIKIELNKENIPVFTETLAEKLKLSNEEIIEECKNDNGRGVVLFFYNDKPVVAGKDIYDDYHQRVLEILEEYHKKNPILEEGLDTKEFYGKFGFTSNDAGRYFVNALINKLLDEKLIKKTGSTYALSQHTVKLDPKTKEQLEWLEKVYANSGIDIPDESRIEEWALSKKIKKERLKMLQKYLAKQGELIFFRGVYVSKIIMNKCRTILLDELKNKERGINEKEVRLLLDTSKKFVQFILNYFIEQDMIYKKTFFVMLTDKGKEMANNI